VTVAGVKLAVAPGGSPLAVNVTALLKAPFCGVTVIGYAATAPAFTLWAAVVALMVKFGAGVPVPFSVTVCGESLALSVTERAALKLAAEVGVKVTEIAQLDPTSSAEPQVLVCAKALAFVPPMEMPAMVSTALPVFVRAIVWSALVVPLTAVKLSDDGAREATGTAAATAIVTAAEVLDASPGSPL
jgi:hypothetical protein